MSKNSGVFIGLNLVLLIFFVKFIPRVFELHGKAFVGELMLFGLFLAVALIAMAAVYFDIDFAFPILMIFFAVSLINTLFLYFNFGFRLYNAVLLSCVGLLGFVISLNKLSRPKLPKLGEGRDGFEIPEPTYKELEKSLIKEDDSKDKTVFEDVEFEKADKKEVAELQKYIDEEKTSAKNSSKAESERNKPAEKYSAVFSPGKFVASKTSTSYHAPKCEWAEKINKKNRIWFASKEDAKKKGYKAHSCLN